MIRCKLCERPITSSKTDPKENVIDTINRLVTHIKERHAAMVESQLSEMIGKIGIYLILTKFADIAEPTSDDLVEAMGTLEDEVLAILEIELEDEDEQGEPIPIS